MNCHTVAPSRQWPLDVRIRAALPDTRSNHLPEGVSSVVDTVDEANGDSRVRFISQKPLASKVTCSKEFRRDLARVLGSGNIKCVAEVKRGARPSASIGR